MFNKKEIIKNYKNQKHQSGIFAVRNKPENKIYIGDSSADYEMAKAAGVCFIGIKSKFNNLKSDHTDYKIYRLNDLPQLITN